MKLAELTEAQFRKYYETRLHDKRFRKSSIGYMALCPFHDDHTPSLSVNTDKGVWKCHACNIGGGVLDFEQRFSSSDKDTALTRIAEVVGEQHLALGQKPEAVYSYTDGFGKSLFEVVRYPGKRFVQRQPDGKGGWIWKTQNLKMVLYRLPEVITAKNCIVVEGEKDADNLTKALAGKPSVAVTTSPRGAGKWQDDFAYYMTGKQVLVIPDNDKVGKEHAARIALSCLKFAQGVKVLELPDVGEHGDVSDFLKDHPVNDLLELAKRTPWWRPQEGEASLFMTCAQFDERSPDYIDWLVEGIVQRKANGILISRPKSGKSFTVLDLALALAGGQKWLDFYIPKRVKTALVSREDNAGLTQWRKKKLAQQRNLTNAELDGYLYINAKGLRPKIMLDYPDDVARLVSDLKRYETEFLILDVMRVLHGSDENDNTEMQKIIDVLNKIQDETGASICLIHHDNKREDATLTERARGASAIAGWAEFICGIRVVDETEWIREFTCELKASMAPEKFYFKINDTPDGGIELARCAYEPPKRGHKNTTQTEAPF